MDLEKIKKQYIFLLLISIIGIIDTTFLVFFGTPINFGVIFPGIAGIFLIGYIFLFSYMKRKWKIIDSKNLRFTIRFLAFGFIVSFVVTQLLIVSSMNFEKANDVKYIILLGGGIDKDKFTVTAQNRVDKALELLKEDKELMVITSGGKDSDDKLSEAEHYREYLLENGIDLNRILVETKSTSTMENFKFSKQILEKTNQFNNKVYVVTSEFHLFRAKMLARRNGLIAFGVPAKTQTLVLPNNIIREYFALVKSLMFDNLEEG